MAEKFLLQTFMQQNRENINAVVSVAYLYKHYFSITIKWDPEKWYPRKKNPRKNVPREKWSPEKWAPENWSPEKWSPENWSPEKWSPENWSPEKWSPEKLSPENWSPENSETKICRVSVEYRGVCVCVCGMLGFDQSVKTQNSETNPKLDNKPKTHKQKIVGWASSIVVCVWNVRLWSIYENPKLDKKPSWTRFLGFYSLAHVGSWGERQTSFCVCSGINR